MRLKLFTGPRAGVGSLTPDDPPPVGPAIRAVPREDDDPVVDIDGPDALDSIRSWLASGAQVVDRRRRFGRHGTTKKLLVVDPAARSNGSERWHTTTSALQRHTVGGALSEMNPEHRRVITLAYLERRTNREIAAPR